MTIQRGRGALPPDAAPLLGLIVGSWVLMLVLLAAGDGDAGSHHTVLGDGGVPAAASFLLFVVAWQVMTAAMMLPTSLPLVRLFIGASHAQAHPRLVLGAFLGGYFAIWTGFAVVALAFDAGLHETVDRWAWLASRPHLVTGPILLLAGAFQFSPLKERCLDACRTPMEFLWRHYGRGPRRAWRLGIRHGVFCLGCCWALMLVMFAVGVGNIVWMAGLTGVMAIEKTAPWGRRLVPPVGATLLLWGAALLLRPDLVPPALGG